MSNTNVRKSRDWFLICSWVFLILAFIGLIIYMSIHVEDLLDADMASDLILSRELATDGGILSGNWYYSTEIKVINAQLVYSLFFHLFEDWQTVRILGNITLYLILLWSYFFLCKKLRISRYFPLTAGILLLPVSGPYFYILMYGAHYIPRVSMMFVILGILMQAPSEYRPKIRVMVSTMIACLLSLALGLEGARMLLILFIPMTIVTGAELLWRIFPRDRQAPAQRAIFLRQAGFPQYLMQAFLVCAFAAMGFLINKTVLNRLYYFKQYDAMILNLTLGSIKGTLANQINVIGYGVLTKIVSIVIWAAVGTLIAWYLLHKGKKNLFTLRFLWICFISWASYTIFSFLINIGQIAWHMVPVAVLFVPAFALVICETHLKLIIQRILCIGLSLCLVLIGIQGYFRFESWPFRYGTRTNDNFQQIAAVLEEKEYRNGYATFWNANVLTELSSNSIEVWTVEQFDEQTAKNPHMKKWLQLKMHDKTLPKGKTFLIWTAKEYETYGPDYFSYLGGIIYQSDEFIVYDVIQ